MNRLSCSCTLSGSPGNGLMQCTAASYPLSPIGPDLHCQDPRVHGQNLLLRILHTESEQKTTATLVNS